MTFSLYDATVANYLQTLGAVGGFLEKSSTHFHNKGIDLAGIVDLEISDSERINLLNAVLADGDQEFRIDMGNVLSAFETSLTRVHGGDVRIRGVGAVDADQDHRVVRGK